MHSFREFLGEVGVISVGILLALGAEQLIEHWHWSEKAQVAEEMITSENRDNFAQAAEQVEVTPCVIAQLDRLEGAVKPNGRFQPVPVYQDRQGSFVMRQPSRAWATDAWESLVADGTADHFDTKRRKSVSDVYLDLATLRRLNGDADAANIKLSVLAKPLELDPSSRLHLFELIEEQKGRAALQADTAKDFMVELRRLQKAPETFPSYTTTGSETRAFCHAQGLPLTNWRREVAAEERKAVTL